MGLEVTPLLAMAIPAAGAVAVALLGRWPNLREAATLTTAALLLAAVLVIANEELARGAAGGNFGPLHSLGEMIPGMALEFRVEALGVIYALVASGLWLLNSVYSIGYMRAHHEKNQTRFYACFGLAMASVMGIAFASNMFTLFVFYEALTMTTYPLVAHASTPTALRGARTYLGVLVTTSICFLLLGTALTWYMTGSLDFSVEGVFATKVSAGSMSGAMVALLYGLFVYGIGKAAVMPAHRWLPAAMVAPTPVSAFLHAVAVVKAGVFSVLKITVYLFGLDTLKSVGGADFFVYAACFTIVAGSGVAMFQDNLKRRLAYSTISQLAYIVLGAALLSPSGIQGAGLHIVMHAWGKITLFFCAGAIMVASHKTDISQMKGLGRKMPFTFGAFAIASISIIGLPPMGGSWSKWYLMMGSLEADRSWIVWVLALSSLMNIAYLMPVATNAFFLSPDEKPSPDAHHEHGEAPLLCVVPLCLTALGSFLLFLYPGPILTLCRMIGS
jgi:multicomponent Na+:H+ antiporter subunit D